ncbi:winged helix-turn-helix domain-containing protein [Actibacterium sp. XHP0104]|uniref:winged helix-turn-helix domain-containing protein n=1 Tax=Actibacterium sp. XHP0104 TaxID=2984335 RepID=UPI0021E90619|nr:LysR family transcriptional regulator [Actibacterium sp. XHP0104]MCV2880634.1 LysR family transcriptional regulator [Actibacterium sp. XHP0104]
MTDDLPPLRIRLTLPGNVPFGPGKADLLQGISETGSISAAGRQMGMSYRRAWSLVEAMNNAFADPLVETSRGGAEGGGARLTRAGLAVLALYRRMQREAEAATVDLRGGVAGMLRDISDET